MISDADSKQAQAPTDVILAATGQPNMNTLNTYVPNTQFQFTQTSELKTDLLHCLSFQVKQAFA